MDSHRRRRTKDDARKAWYAHYRQVRFARWFGFIPETTGLDKNCLDSPSITRPEPVSLRPAECHGNAPC
jgi:hypothetical protein